MVDVEEFVGVKSCKAKGKRLTTYDVATLTFIEPEIEDIDEAIEAADFADDAMAEPIEEMVEESEIANAIEPVDNSGTPIEIIRNDVDDTISEQLNLF